ncbi:MAG: hypothetical protein ACK6AD_13640 [Cyanobacteriota bacterium]
MPKPEGDAMPTKLSRPLHIPRLPRSDALGLLSWRAGTRPGTALVLPGHPPQGRSDDSSGAELSSGWRRRAVREGLVATLVTSLLTSAVLAAPEMFRQSPAVSWRQFTTPALALGQRPDRGVLLDCP